MTGTILNAAGILIGGILGLTLRKQLSVQRQLLLKLFIGALIVFVGLQMTWASLGGGLWSVLKQLGIMLLALTVGNILGKLLRIQKGFNHLGQMAAEKLKDAEEKKSRKFAEAFVAGTLLFCVGPISILGALFDGFDSRWQTLGIKGLIDGLAVMALVGSLGWGVILAVIPVVAYQGTITLCARLLIPVLQEKALMDSLNATGGMLIFCLALIILEIRKVEVADYLPSLVVAPLLTWWWLR